MPPRRPQGVLWMGGLDDWMDEGYVANLFAPAFLVQSVKLMRRSRGRWRSYAFVDFGVRARAALARPRRPLDACVDEMSRCRLDTPDVLPWRHLIGQHGDLPLRRIARGIGDPRPPFAIRRRPVMRRRQPCGRSRGVRCRAPHDACFASTGPSSASPRRWRTSTRSSLGIWTFP